MKDTARPTMKHVANEAGVSFKTVSRVVNDEPGVSPELRDRVLEAIAVLDYQPDDRARTLRQAGSRSATIGFIHADMANPFFVAVQTAVEAVATAENSLMLTGTSGEQADRQEALVRAFSGRRVDGLVIVVAGRPGAACPALAEEISRETPVVFIDRDPRLDSDLVLSDHKGGARNGTDHLIAGGHTRIAFMGDHRYLHSAAERRIGFLDAMAAAGLTPSTVISDVDNPEDAESAVIELMKLPADRRPTALFTAQNYLTLGAVKALHGLGLQHEIALVGFDDIPMGDLVRPGVTVVPQDAERLGLMAAEMLFERIADRSIPPRRQVLPLNLVQRGSGEIAAKDLSTS